MKTNKKAALSRSVTYEDSSLEYLVEDPDFNPADFVNHLNSLHSGVSAAVDFNGLEITLRFARRADLKEFFARKWQAEGGPSVNEADIEDMMADLGV
jgi:hypothetical protein